MFSLTLGFLLLLFIYCHQPQSLLLCTRDDRSFILFFSYLLGRRAYLSGHAFLKNDFLPSMVYVVNYTANEFLTLGLLCPLSVSISLSNYCFPCKQGLYRVGTFRIVQLTLLFTQRFLISIDTRNF